MGVDLTLFVPLIPGNKHNPTPDEIATHVERMSKGGVLLAMTELRCERRTALFE
jgi:hypothetical protein